MNINTHPSSENIFAFLDDPESENFKDLELHLASCSNCRMQVNRLSHLQKEIQSSDFIQQKLIHDITAQKSTVLEAALNDGKIEDYVDQKLDKNEYQNVNNLIQNDPQALKAALHYASHQSAMQRELLEPVTKITKATNYFDLAGLLKKYFTMRTPAWVMIPATGFASVIIVFALNTQMVEQQDLINIASYQDNAVIQYSGKNTQPGIGFFTNPFSKIKPFKGITIRVFGVSTIKLHWPKIEDAISYTMQLQKIVKGQNITIGESSGKSNSIEFKNIKLDNNRRYQWILTGKTTNNETFHTSGGFVGIQNKLRD